MKFSAPLVKGKLIKRYKRFLADVELETGDVVTAHCPNTGSMKTCGAPGDTVVLTHNPSPKRKLAYSWEYTKTSGGYIGVNTMHPNKIAEEAIRDGLIPELSGYDLIKREVKYGNENSRIDILLEDSTGSLPKCYVEVKNVTLKHDDHLRFPDAVTARGLKHLRELSSVIDEGHRACLLFVANRPDGKYVSIANDIDPKYGEGILDALNAGVEIFAYQVKSNLNEMVIKGRIPFHH